MSETSSNNGYLLAVHGHAAHTRARILRSYMSVHDAINAKDDILNRLGGQIHTVAHGNFIVRIGFGKADSLPPTPASVLQARPAAQTAGVSVAPSGTSLAGSIEAQLQTSPTRALWIGSIPASVDRTLTVTSWTPWMYN